MSTELALAVALSVKAEEIRLTASPRIGLPAPTLRRAGVEGIEYTSTGEKCNGGQTNKQIPTRCKILKSHRSTRRTNFGTYALLLPTSS